LPENEAERRYYLHKVDLPYTNDYPIIAQHYGMKTIGLDVTFNIRIAFFFACNQFHIDNKGKARSPKYN
jgi:hypothetical protein